jgi:hypothetical protein
MVDPAEMAERHAHILAELSELGMGLARKACADADAAETPEERARAALVFQRVSRSIRQSLALEAKLAREAARDADEARAEAARQDRERVRLRKHQIRNGVDALVWRETEDMDEDEEEAFEVQILGAIEDEACSDTLFTDDLADQVGRVIERLGFEVGLDGAVRRKPAIPQASPEPEPYWHSSA